MSENCTDCRDSILNRQKSKIGVPQCNDECPTETDCQGKQTYTDCVGVNSALPCVGTTTSDNLTTVLEAIDEKICDVAESNCTIKVSADDCGCGYLEDKLVAGVGITLTTLTDNPTNCQTIQISTNPGSLVWNNIPLTANFASNTGNVSGYQIPQYSDPDALGRVWFRGSFTTASDFGNVSLGVNSSALPINSRPAFARTFWNGRTNVNNALSPQIIVLNTGTILFVNNTGTTAVANKCIVSFDGFWIDTN